MPSYKFTGAAEVVLPDVPLVVSPGEVVDLPDWLFTDADQAAAIGFIPADVPATTPEAAPAADASQE